MSDGRQTYAEELTHVLRQVVGVVLLSWQRILRVGVMSAVLAVVITEVVACRLTSSFPPPPATHLVAVALAFAVGYGVAVTTLVAMLLRGGIRFIQHLEGDATVGAHAASMFARREVSNLGAGVRRVFASRPGVFTATPKKATVPGARSSISARPRPPVVARGARNPRSVQEVAAYGAVAAAGFEMAHAASVRSAVVSRPLAAQPGARRDPDDAIMRAPAPAVQSLPVLASRMPRIGWTYDDSQPQQPQQSNGVMPATPAPARTSEPVQPVAAPASNPGSEPPADPSAEMPADPPGAVTSEAAERTDASRTLDVASAAAVPRGTPDVPGLIPRGMQRNGSGRTTRPLPAVTRPLPAVDGGRQPGGVRSGSLWERVSQALVGQTGVSELAGDSNEAGDNQSPPEAEFVPDDAWLAE